MSGGSFDYLYGKADLDELGSANEYQRMADSLASHGHAHSAQLTAAIVAHLREAARLAKLLQGVHRAEEWYTSGDSGPESVVDAEFRLPPSNRVISSVRVERRGHHEHVSVWTRGALSGTLIMEIGDWEQIAARLGL
jgi:hypothetical protein